MSHSILERQFLVTNLRQYRYRTVDVFTRRQFEGNPLAVFLDGADLATEQMQRIAAELNLSETVFVCAATLPGCVARLRIFTPRKEMDFAGHPTVGSGYILLTEGLVPASAAYFHVQENVGAILIRVDPGEVPMFWLTTPEIREGPTVAPQVAAALLQLREEDLLGPAPQILNAGNPTLLIPVRDVTALDRAELAQEVWRKFKQERPDPLCVFAFTPRPEGAYSRMFAPDYGIAEDPATGSSTGPLAAYMMRHKLAPTAAGTKLISEQGTKMGRRSFLHIAIDGERGSDGIRVGGEVTPVLEGRLILTERG